MKTCDRCKVEVEDGETLCGWCECDDRNHARRKSQDPFETLIWRIILWSAVLALVSFVIVAVKIFRT
jgi:hypothetical protein